VCVCVTVFVARIASGEKSGAVLVVCAGVQRRIHHAKGSASVNVVCV